MTLGDKVLICIGADLTIMEETTGSLNELRRGNCRSLLVVRLDPYSSNERSCCTTFLPAVHLSSVWVIGEEALG